MSMGILLGRHVAVGNVCNIIMAFNKDACSVSLRCAGLPNNELLGSGARVSVGVREIQLLGSGARVSVGVRE